MLVGVSRIAMNLRRHQYTHFNLAFFLVFMGVMCLIYSVCALRTNIVLFLILFILVPTFSCLAGAYFYLAEAAAGDKTAAAKAAPLQLAGGALAFVVCMLGWYIFTAIILASLDFPFALPGMTVLYKSRKALADTRQSAISPISSKGPARRALVLRAHRMEERYDTRLAIPFDGSGAVGMEYPYVCATAFQDSIRFHFTLAVYD